MSGLSILAIFALFAALTGPSGVPTPGPAPGGIVYLGNPAVRLRLESRPLGFDPDGNARWAVIAHFSDAHDAPARILLGSDLDYRQNRGVLQWQTRMRYGQPAAILKTTQDGPLTMTVTAKVPVLPPVAVQTDTRTWRTPRVVAAPLGPHLIQIGWFPREAQTVRIVRSGAGSQTVTTIRPPSSTFRDMTVSPGRSYTYRVLRSGKPPMTLFVRAMDSLPPASAGALTGKGMWLSFSINPAEDGYVARIDPHALVQRAVAAGLHYVELRVAYGEFWEISPQAKPVIDAIIDGLDAHHIGVIGWTVPREASFADIQTSVRAANYRTARGTRLEGLAVDLERGEEFLHDCPDGCIAIAHYISWLRKAVGPTYPIVATVEDPFLENLNDTTYPYAVVARNASVLQPMIYWWAMSKTATSATQTSAIIAGAVRRLHEVSGRVLPVSIGGQTSKIGPRGSTPADQIPASLRASKSAGAIGECFFDWAGTQNDQWDEIARFNW